MYTLKYSYVYAMHVGKLLKRSNYLPEGVSWHPALSGTRLKRNNKEIVRKEISLSIEVKSIICENYLIILFKVRLKPVF